VASRRWIKRWVQCRSIKEVKQSRIVIQAKKWKGAGRVITGILDLTGNPFEGLERDDIAADLSDRDHYGKHDQQTKSFQITV
jgi:hypothetical protein